MMDVKMFSGDLRSKHILLKSIRRFSFYNMLVFSCVILFRLLAGPALFHCLGKHPSAKSPSLIATTLPNRPPMSNAMGCAKSRLAFVNRDIVSLVFIWKVDLFQIIVLGQAEMERSTAAIKSASRPFMCPCHRFAH